MSNPLTRRLELFGALSNDDKRLLDDVVKSPRTVGQRRDIIREGDAPSNVHLVLDGLACRYKLLHEGERQFFAYFVPGDFCDLNVFILKTMDHTIATISNCTLVDIPRSRVLELTERAAIARALWWATLVDEAILREWLVNLGQRDAAERIAHLFCELHLRLASVGLSPDDEFELPLTQPELGDTLGLSTVHVNRSLQSLRTQNLIQFKNGILTIPNLAALQHFCGFSPNYLHLDGGKRDARGMTRRPAGARPRRDVDGLTFAIEPSAHMRMVT